MHLPGHPFVTKSPRSASRLRIWEEAAVLITSISGVLLYALVQWRVADCAVLSKIS